MLGPQDTHEEVAEKPQPETATAMKPTTVDDIDRLMVARALRMDNVDEMKKHERRIDKILLWAKDKGATSEVDLLSELAQLRNKMGNPTIYDISVYIGLENQRREAEKALQDINSKMGKFHGEK